MIKEKDEKIQKNEIDENIEQVEKVEEVDKVEEVKVKKENKKVKVMFLINVKYQDKSITTNGTCDVSKAEADEFIGLGIAKLIE